MVVTGGPGWAVQVRNAALPAFLRGLHPEQLAAVCTGALILVLPGCSTGARRPPADRDRRGDSGAAGTAGPAGRAAQGGTDRRRRRAGHRRRRQPGARPDAAPDRPAVRRGRTRRGGAADRLRPRVCRQPGSVGDRRRLIRSNGGKSTRRYRPAGIAAEGAARGPEAATPVTMRQDLTPTHAAFPAIWLGAIGGPKNADSHSLAHPVGQVAGATNDRTPPVACSPEPGGARALPALRLTHFGTTAREPNHAAPTCTHSYVGHPPSPRPAIARQTNNRPLHTTWHACHGTPAIGISAALPPHRRGRATPAGAGSSASASAGRSPA